MKTITLIEIESHYKANLLTSTEFMAILTEYISQVADEDNLKGFEDLLFFVNEKELLKAKNIINTICKYFGITKKMAFAKIRKREVTYVRQFIQYFLKKETGLTLSAIGLITGGKDHSTVRYSVESVENLMQYDKKTKSDEIKLSELIGIDNDNL